MATALLACYYNTIVLQRPSLVILLPKQQQFYEASKKDNDSGDDQISQKKPNRNVPELFNHKEFNDFIRDLHLSKSARPLIEIEKTI